MSKKCFASGAKSRQLSQSDRVRNKLRKQRTSPLCTVAREMLKKEYNQLYKKFAKYAKENRFKTQKNFTYPCIILKLIFEYKTMKESSTSEMIVNCIFQKVKSQLDREIESSYKDKNCHEEMKKRSHADIVTIQKAFLGGFDDLNKISQRLKPLYDPTVVNQPHHQINRELLASAIQRFTLVKVGIDYEIQEMTQVIFSTRKQPIYLSSESDQENGNEPSSDHPHQIQPFPIDALNPDFRETLLTLVPDSFLQSKYEFKIDFLHDNLFQADREEAPQILHPQSQQCCNLDMWGEDYEHIMEKSTGFSPNFCNVDQDCMLGYFIQSQEHGKRYNF